MNKQPFNKALTSRRGSFFDVCWENNVERCWTVRRSLNLESRASGLRPKNSYARTGPLGSIALITGSKESEQSFSSGFQAEKSFRLRTAQQTFQGSADLKSLYMYLHGKHNKLSHNIIAVFPPVWLRWGSLTSRVAKRQEKNQSQATVQFFFHCAVSIWS